MFWNRFGDLSGQRIGNVLPIHRGYFLVRNEESAEASIVLENVFCLLRHRNDIQYSWDICFRNSNHVIAYQMTLKHMWTYQAIANHYNSNV